MSPDYSYRKDPAYRKDMGDIMRESTAHKQSVTSPEYKERKRQESIERGAKPPVMPGASNPMFGKCGHLSPHFKGYKYCACGKQLWSRLAEKCNRCNKLKPTTPLYTQIRKIMEYRQWRSDVFTRDEFTCQACFKKGGRLQAHHIKAFSQILKDNNVLSLRQALDCDELWNLNNGVTLCIPCHEKTESYMKSFLKKGI